MSNNNFSRRRRGMRFRPKGGLGPNPQKPDREAIEARADVVAEQGGNDRVFEKRHTHEIERAENIAAGLPPEGKPEEKPQTPANIPDKKDFREPHSEIPAQVKEEKEEFQPVAIQQPPKGILAVSYTHLDVYKRQPYENPKYAVVVMVESGISGGTTCAPIAHDIYKAILQSEQQNVPKVLARN